MQWFSEVQTVPELRKKYRELLKQYHPDNVQGSVQIAQEINAEYDARFASLSCKDDTKKSYTKEENEKFKSIINEIITFDITIEIIGSWIWCFDCYQYKNILKELGFTWCSNKKAWVWHDASYHIYHKEEISLNCIRNKYGSQMVKMSTDQASLDKKT